MKINSSTSPSPSVSAPNAANTSMGTFVPSPLDRPLSANGAGMGSENLWQRRGCNAAASYHINIGLGASYHNRQFRGDGYGADLQGCPDFIIADLRYIVITQGKFMPC